MLNIINTEAVMLILLLILVGVPVLLMTLYLFKDIFLFGNKAEKRILTGFTIFALALFIL